jgi:hypothetical protein
MRNVPEKKHCYSNAIHHKDEANSTAPISSMQSKSYVQELLRQQWLSNSEESLKRSVREEADSMSVAREKGANLLRKTKLRVIERLRGVA